MNGIMNWVRIASSRQPIPGTFVWVTSFEQRINRANDSDEYCSEVQLAYYDNGTFFLPKYSEDCRVEIDEIINVTHWQPLEKPLVESKNRSIDYLSSNSIREINNYSSNKNKFHCTIEEAELIEAALDAYPEYFSDDPSPPAGFREWLKTVTIK